MINNEPINNYDILGLTNDSPSCASLEDVGNVEYAFATLPRKGGTKSVNFVVKGIGKRLALEALEAIITKAARTLNPLASSMNVIISGSLTFSIEVDIVGAYRCCLCNRSTDEVLWGYPKLYQEGITGAEDSEIFGLPEEKEELRQAISGGMKTAIEVAKKRCGGVSE